MFAAVRRLHQRDQIGARAEARVDVEEVLHPVAVVVVALHALAKHRRQPQGGHAEIGEVAELAGNAVDGPPLKPPPELRQSCQFQETCPWLAA